LRTALHGFLRASDLGHGFLAWPADHRQQPVAFGAGTRATERIDVAGLIASISPLILLPEDTSIKGLNR
jgi:hypothetical protein